MHILFAERELEFRDTKFEVLISRHAIIVLDLKTIIATKLFREQIKIYGDWKVTKLNKNEFVKIFMIRINNYK